MKESEEKSVGLLYSLNIHASMKCRQRHTNQIKEYTEKKKTTRLCEKSKKRKTDTYKKYNKRCTKLTVKTAGGRKLTNSLI